MYFLYIYFSQKKKIIFDGRDNYLEKDFKFIGTDCRILFYDNQAKTRM